MEAFGNHPLVKFGAITTFRSYVDMIQNQKYYLRDIRDFDLTVFIRNNIVKEILVYIKSVFGINYNISIEKTNHTYSKYIIIQNDVRRLARINIYFRLYTDKTFDILIYVSFNQRMTDLHYELIKVPVIYDDGMITMSIKNDEYTSNSFNPLIECMYSILTNQ